MADALALVRLDPEGRQRPAQLSGGMQQRVALARALVYRPRVLLLDEPLAALDKKLREEMRGELREIQRTVGITTVFVTHDQTEALGLSDRIAVMNRGRIEQLAAPRDDLRAAGDALRGRTSSARSSVLRGRAVAPDRVEIPAGVSLRVDSLPLPVGAPVELAIRPERVAIGSSEGEGGMDGKGGENVVSGKASQRSRISGR